MSENKKSTTRYERLRKSLLVITLLTALCSLLTVSCFDGNYVIRQITDSLLEEPDEPLVESPVTFVVGDTGPGGGKIFYVSEEGFTMADTGETCHYLEAAPANASDSNVTWASNFNDLIPDLSQSASDETDWAIGRGRKNTAIIIARGAAIGYETPAASACIAYTSGGKDDWFLPSREELQKLYDNRALADMPTSGYFWSSSQYDSNSSWYVNFASGGRSNSPSKVATINVRAIRAF